jgi:RimJ/RimL family protein N-acetyltransferase
MQLGQQVLGLGRIVAITSPDNHSSMSVLRRLGLEFERTLRIPDQSRDTRLFTPAVRSLLSTSGHSDEEDPDEKAEAG